MFKLSRYLFLAVLFISNFIIARDVLLEFKGAYFRPTDSCVRKIYGNGAALYGPEVTFNLCGCNNWYGFASVDFLIKKGHSIGLCDRTTMHIMPVALGVKYLVPFCYGDFYLGLGFEATRLRTKNCSPFAIPFTSKWGFGAIAKLGAFFELPCNYFLDLFVDYSIARVGCDKCLIKNVVPLKARLDGAIFGVGIGYRFN